jgi:hypothetical protein
MVEEVNGVQGAFWELNRSFSYAVAQYYDKEKQPVFSTVDDQPGSKDVQRLRELCERSTKALAQGVGEGTLRQDIWRYEGVFTGVDPFERDGAEGPQGYFTTAILAFPLQGAVYYLLGHGGYALLLLCVAAIWFVMLKLIYRKKEGRSNE